MSDDQQKELSSNGAVARAEQRTPAVRHEGVIALAATAMGTLALGAIAIGALAIGKMAIGDIIGIGRSKRRNDQDQVEDLVIARLTIRELTIERLR